MAIAIESLGKPRDPEVGQRIGETEAENLLRYSIWIASHSAGREHILLFALTKTQGFIKDLSGKMYKMEASKLQEIGLKVMKEEGLREDVYDQVEVDEEEKDDVVRFPAQNVSFERHKCLDEETEQTYRVRWFVIPSR